MSSPNWELDGLSGMGYDPNNCPLLSEYNSLKAEQVSRIGFRDNLLYATLGAFGALLSFSLLDATHLYALLVVPWVSIVLGWTYLVNDEKISAIGRYIRTSLTPLVREKYALDKGVFQWEPYHRSDGRRRLRKITQHAIDQATYIGSSLASIVAFVMLVEPKSAMVNVLLVTECAATLFLGFKFFLYADTQRESMDISS